VQRLREERGNGFLFANGGFATDNHCIVIASQPIAAARFPQNFDYQAEADAAREEVPSLAKDYVGSALVESYTVFHDPAGHPAGGVVVARTPDGQRTLCHIDVQDPAMVAFFMGGQIEPVSRQGRIVVEHGKRSWQKLCSAT